MRRFRGNSFSLLIIEVIWCELCGGGCVESKAKWGVGLRLFRINLKWRRSLSLPRQSEWKTLSEGWKLSLLLLHSFPQPTRESTSRQEEISDFCFYTMKHPHVTGFCSLRFAPVQLSFLFLSALLPFIDSWHRYGAIFQIPNFLLMFRKNLKRLNVDLEWSMSAHLHNQTRAHHCCQSKYLRHQFRHEIEAFFPSSSSNLTLLVNAMCINRKFTRPPTTRVATLVESVEEIATWAWAVRSEQNNHHTTFDEWMKE